MGIQRKQRTKEATVFCCTYVKICFKYLFFVPKMGAGGTNYVHYALEFEVCQ